MSGYGELYDPNLGVVYIGYFLDNKYSGFGILKRSKENYIYIGYWKENNRDGIGKSFKGNKKSIARYSNNVKIHEYPEDEDISRLIYEEHHIFLKFFKGNIRDIKRFVSEIRILKID